MQMRRRLLKQFAKNCFPTLECLCETIEPSPNLHDITHVINVRETITDPQHNSAWLTK